MHELILARSIETYFMLLLIFLF